MRRNQVKSYVNDELLILSDDIKCIPTGWFITSALGIFFGELIFECAIHWNRAKWLSPSVSLINCGRKKYSLRSTCGLCILKHRNIVVANWVHLNIQWIEWDFVPYAFRNKLISHEFNENLIQFIVLQRRHSSHSIKFNCVLLHIISAWMLYRPVINIYLYFVCELFPHFLPHLCD